MIDALFRAGVEYVWGKVEPPFYPSAWQMNQARLIRFYEQNGFLNCGDARIWKHSPYKALAVSVGDSPKSDAADPYNATGKAAVL